MRHGGLDTNFRDPNLWEAPKNRNKDSTQPSVTMKKLDPQTLKSRRAFLKKTAKRAVLPMLVAYALKNPKPLYGESRRGQVL